MSTKMTRRAFVGGSAALLSLGLAACGGDGSGAPADDAAADQAAESTTITVFAAASMEESLTKAGELFTEENPQYELSFNFDSSGTLKTQIEEGADCDVFISAGQLQMNQLDAADTTGDNVDGLDLIDSETRFDILENKVALAVPEGNPKGIESFDQLAELLASGDVFMAMGNSDVPVGQYTQAILEHYGLDEEALAAAGTITYGFVDVATPEMCGQVVYPAAATKNAPNPEGAAAFLEFLRGSEASACFEEVGFTPLAEA